jgi:hypothetical protein
MSGATRLTDDRLASIEQGALERYTLLDRVIIELVEEVRRLRQIVAGSSPDEHETPEHRSEPAMLEPGTVRNAP